MANYITNKNCISPEMFESLTYYNDNTTQKTSTPLQLNEKTAVRRLFSPPISPMSPKTNKHNGNYNILVFKFKINLIL